jgi:hypothetical protein
MAHLAIMCAWRLILLETLGTDQKNKIRYTHRFYIYIYIYIYAINSGRRP